MKRPLSQIDGLGVCLPYPSLLLFTRSDQLKLIDAMQHFILLDVLLDL